MPPASVRILPYVVLLVTLIDPVLVIGADVGAGAVVAVGGTAVGAVVGGTAVGGTAVGAVVGGAAVGALAAGTAVGGGGTGVAVGAGAHAASARTAIARITTAKMV
jgi:hypothetical protein